MQNQPKCQSVEQLKAMWNGMAPTYNIFDATMQTFYYTLVNMMKISEAKHIYEVACGICKMVPYTLSLKSQTCTYLATDLSQKMVELAKGFLATYIHKLGVTDSVEKWMEKQCLEIGVHNGELPPDSPHKFDRIICNLVLMNTTDAHKMMRSMHEAAENECLLGVTIWGDKKLSNFMTLPMQAKIVQGKPIPNVRENFHLYNKLEELGRSTGWEMVRQWEQSSPFNTIQFDEGLTKLIRGVSELDAEIISYVEGKVKDTFDAKGVLNFPVQMAIFRKK